MDLSSEICQGNEMERYLYPMDGTSEGITTAKSILSITIARKQRGLTRGTGKLNKKRHHPTGPHVKSLNSWDVSDVNSDRFLYNCIWKCLNDVQGNKFVTYSVKMFLNDYLFVYFYTYTDILNIIHLFCSLKC